MTARFATLLLSFVSVTFPAAWLAAEETAVEPGFVSMFNGVDFSGWQFGGGYGLPDPLPENWKVEDGLIKLSGGGRPNLGSQWDYEDFDMRFQWRAAREKYNSGFYIRSRRKVGNNQINLAKGAEGRFFGGKMNGGPAVPELQKPATEWNEWRVLVEGDHVTFWCNGRLAWKGTEFASTRGHIGLQAEGAPLEFRNLRIKELGYDGLNELGKNWTAASGNWKQEGDAIVTSGSGSPLVTAKKDYTNYHLRLEWAAEKGGSGGIALRGNEKQALVRLTSAGNSGTITGADASGDLKLENPAGQWNYLQVRVTGGKATVWLNGTDVVKDAVLKSAVSAGPIALVPTGGVLKFRNLRIKRLE